MKASAEGPALTFIWPQRERFPVLLFGCVFLSLIAHVATFFLFQVIYPQRVTIPSPPPQIELLTASSPENEALLRWIDAEDPALVASANAVLPPHLLEFAYQPSFATKHPSPLGSVEIPEKIPFPAARSSLSIILSGVPRAEPSSRVAVATPTGISFSGNLRDRATPPPTSYTWKQRTNEPLDSLRALIGVSDRGEVRHTFLQQSSGQAAFDSEALQILQQLNFSKSNEPIVWGFVSVTFGADAYVDNTVVSVGKSKNR